MDHPATMHFHNNPDPAALLRGTATVGDAEILVCTDGTALFDGGAMFGVVPKTLWQRRIAADSLNRIAIGLNCVVVRLGGSTVLIESGFGNKLSPKLQAIYGTQGLLPASLAAAGVSPASVDLVLNTHLHWDHCGWNTVLDGEGTPQPFFPNARYLVHQGEVDHGRLRLSRDRVSYVPENYEPLLATGQMQTVSLPTDGTVQEILPGISLECFPGHTAQLMAVHLQSRGQHACFVSDLVPTTAHLDEASVMAFDLDPLRTIEERRRFFQRAISQDWLVLFPHDHLQPMAKLTSDPSGSVRVA